MVREQIGAGGLFQSGDGRPAAAQDPFGQDFTRHDQENCRRRRISHAATIDDPLILDEITADLSALGYPAGSARSSA